MKLRHHKRNADRTNQHSAKLRVFVNGSPYIDVKALAHPLAEQGDFKDVDEQVYLEYADGEGHWYPCESAGTRAFGEMPLARTILQKGDNFRVPERRELLRYASDYLVGLPTPGGGRPKVKYIRQQLP